MKAVSIHLANGKYLTGDTVNSGAREDYFGAGGTIDEERVCLGNQGQVCQKDYYVP
jgi:hypothetical protein